VDLVVDTILYVSKKKNLFLAIDELMKAGGHPVVKIPNRPLDVVGIVGGILNAYENVVALITTLDQGNCFLANTAAPLIGEKISSGRAICWFPLDLLSKEEALSLFNGGKLDGRMRLLISDCNGHPRSLQYMWQVFSDLDWDVSAYSYAKLVEKFVETYGTFIPPPASVVKECLLGQQVELLSHPSEDAKTFQQYVETGVLINSNVGGMHSL
jgi:hypothetical protein